MIRQAVARILLACGLAGCGGGPIPEIRLTVAQSANLGTGQSCRSVGDGLLNVLGGASKLRLTMRSRGRQATRVCDALFPIASRPALGVSALAGDPVDVFAEVFDDQHARLASGALLGLDLTASSSPKLRLIAVESFRCGGATLQRPRAFHSATPLPNGQILVVGGLAPNTGDTEGPAEGGKLFITSKAEVYDPLAGAFVVLADAEGALVPRALHQAALLPDDGSGAYRILLAGGITAPAGANPSLQEVVAGGGGFRYVPTGGAMVGSAPPRLLTYDPVARTVRESDGPSSLPSYAFAGGVALGAGGLMVAGGAKSDLWTAEAVVAATSDGATVKSLPSAHPRFGPAVAELRGGVALIVGGGTGIAASPFERVLFGEGASSSAPLFPVTGTFSRSWQFVTLTRLPERQDGVERMLVSGALEAGPLPNPPADPNGGLYLLNYSSAPSIAVTPATATGVTFDTTCTDASRYRPAAFNAATLLKTGDRVLVTGGSPRYEPTGCNDCEGGDAGVSCALTQAAIVSVDGAVLTRTAAPLGIARFGHTQTLLGDGRVLIVGGFTRRLAPAGNPPALATFAAADTEVWNPDRALEVDDPVAAELAAQRLSREPGGLAYRAGDPTKAAAIACLAIE